MKYVLERRVNDEWVEVIPELYITTAGFWLRILRDGETAWGSELYRLKPSTEVALKYAAGKTMMTEKKENMYKVVAKEPGGGSWSVKKPSGLPATVINELFETGESEHGGIKYAVIPTNPEVLWHLAGMNAITPQKENMYGRYEVVCVASHVPDPNEEVYDEYLRNAARVIDLMSQESPDSISKMAVSAAYAAGHKDREKISNDLEYNPMKAGFNYNAIGVQIMAVLISRLVNGGYCGVHNMDDSLLAKWESVKEDRWWEA